MRTVAAPTPGIDARVTWFVQECTRNGVRIEGYVRSAERIGDREMAAFFRRALREAHRIASGVGR